MRTQASARPVVIQDDGVVTNETTDEILSGIVHS